eukprot:CAMPEP_0117426708 /NCGR_PEP_ID=MMETSP0758-20121206/6746_1 /TAXON_ID=63605 /ORGANISM="Percolomonas cosmopolitus, Strain AE-1 (ATCC 50343)" /LENGTH=149 /DNA_ID=CAMNT_0005211995 /DNA_START=554 /DNA_END=1000 /DNA_ORIENTATION=-
MTGQNYVDYIEYISGVSTPHHNILPSHHKSYYIGSAVTLSDGTAILYGGGNLYKNETNGEVTALFPSTLTTERRFSHTPRMLHSAVLYKNKYMYVYGGYDGENVLNDLSMYNVERDYWKVINQNALPTPSFKTELVIYNDILRFYYGVT